MSTHITVNPEQCREDIVDCMLEKVSVMVHGSPGIGKSAIVHSIAEEYRLYPIDVRLAQCDPTDLNGFPQLDAARQKAGYAPMDTFPLEGEPVPDGYDGWMLFLDEFNSGSLSVQAAAYKIMLDRMIGQKRLHSRCAIVAAGNLQTDGAIVNRLSTALQSRMAHLELALDTESFLKWAYANGVDSRITSYLEWKPESIYTFSAQHSDKTYACPRTWDFANRFVKKWAEIPQRKLALLSGVIGQGPAREFMQFCQIYQDLPKMADIVAQPDTAKVSDRPDVNYAVTGAISEHAKETNIDQLVKYVKRLPMEFQYVTMRGMLTRNPNLRKSTSVSAWVTDLTALM